MPMSSSAEAPSAGSSIRSSGPASTRKPSSACRCRGVPNSPARQPRAQLPDHRVAGRPHRLHQEPVVLAGQPDHLLGVGRVERERLLAEHVLAGLEAQPGVVEVEGVRRRDVDDVDVRVRHQLLVGAVRRARTPRRTPARRPGRCSRRREPTAASRAPGTSARSRAKVRAILPVARIPQRMSPSMSSAMTRRVAAGDSPPRRITSVVVRRPIVRLTSMSTPFGGGTPWTPRTRSPQTRAMPRPV